MNASRRDAATLLRERAELLAQPEVQESHAVHALATFTIGGYTIGVALGCVLRAAELRHLTEIPGAPPHLLGLAAVEGHLVSLLDLAVLLGLPRQGVSDLSGVMVIGSGGRQLGLGAEALLGIVDVMDSTVQSLPGGTQMLGRVARGQGAYGSDIMLLDVEALFDDPRLGNG